MAFADGECGGKWRKSKKYFFYIDAPKILLIVVLSVLKLLVDVIMGRVNVESHDYPYCGAKSIDFPTSFYML